MNEQRARQNHAYRIPPPREQADLCRKRSFRTKRDAKASVAKDKHGKTFHAYLCRCGCWHLTTHGLHLPAPESPVD